jgi:MarR family transcriptional regulator for hemolysin
MKKTALKYEQPLGRIFSRLGKEFLSIVNSKLKGLDIERSFYPLILIENAKGNITQQELADQMEVDKVSIVRIVDYLSEAGYVERALNPHDRRKYCLVLTPKARKEMGRISKALNESRDIAFKGISEKRKLEFYKTLEDIKENFSNSNSI